MAYYKSNPDDLPIHAEPEQAAQHFSQLQGGGGRGAPHPTRPQAQQHPQGQPSYGRPQPPIPPQGGGGGYGGHQGGYGQQQQPQHQLLQSQQQHQQPPPQQYGYTSPPPGAFHQPPLPQQATSPRPGSSRPPPTPAPPQGADPTLYPLFKAVDKDGSGQLSEKELRAALVNGDWTSFDPHTVRMMIRMFDTDRDGTIGFNEFCGLWGFLAAWRQLFDRFDADKSGNISLNEFSNALAAFGYRLSPQFVQLLFRSYDKRGEEPQVSTGANAISFDLFVQSCISLKRMTEVFKKYDDDRDGYITLSFEDFLTEILRQR